MLLPMSYVKGWVQGSPNEEMVRMTVFSVLLLTRYRYILINTLYEEATRKEAELGNPRKVCMMKRLIKEPNLKLSGFNVF